MTRKRVLLWLGLPLLLLLLAVALLYGFRREVAGWLIDRELAELGLQGSRYRLVELDSDSALFTALTLPDGRVAAQMLRLDYELLDLLRGRLRRVEVTGLRVAPNFVQEMNASDGGGGLPPALPEIVLTDAKVGLPTALGMVSLSFDLTADTEGTALTLKGWLPDPLKAYEAERSSLAITAEGTLPPLQTLLSGPLDSAAFRLAGSATLEAEGVSLPEEVERLDLHLPLAWRFEGNRLTAQTDADGAVGSLKLPDFENGTLTLQPDPLLDLQLLPAGYSVTLTPDLRFTTPSGPWLRVSASVATQLAPDLTPAPLAVEGLIAEGGQWQIDAHAIDRFTLTGTLAGPPEALQGPLDLELLLERTEIGRFPVEGLALAGSFQAILSPTAITLTLAEPAKATVRQAYDGDSPLLPQGLTADVEQATLSLDWAGALRLEHSTSLSLGQQRAAVGSGKDALTVTGDFGRLEIIGQTYDDFVYGGTLHLASPNLDLASFGLNLQGLDLTWIFPAPGEAATPARFSVARSSLTTGMGRLSGMTLEGEIVESESGLSLTGKGRGPGGSGTLTLALTDDSLTANWGSVTFKPKGLQPSAILSSFKDFKDVSGNMKAALKLTWGAKSSSLLTVTLNDLGFQHPLATVEGLSTTITLDQLAQLSTRASKLTARRIDIGLPMTDVVTTLRIKPGRSPTFVLTDTAFTLAGGRFGMTSLEYNETAKTVSGTVTVQGLDLAELGRELAVEDLSFEGRMNGSLPITFGPADESVAVTGGRLTAAGPGVIRYGKPGTASLRAGGDSNFALALQALEDFRFQIFDIGFDKAAEGRTLLAIRLQGSNPAVLDGHPFHININLQTDLSQVLEALREGYRLNPNLFKGGWTFQ